LYKLKELQSNQPLKNQRREKNIAPQIEAKGKAQGKAQGKKKRVSSRRMFRESIVPY
jgi:hypothetical protein